MSSDQGWQAAQMPRFVQATGLNASFVDPGKKAAEAEYLKRQVEEFMANGGVVEVVVAKPRRIRSAFGCESEQKYIDSRAKGRATQARQRGTA